jgi:hypothetical protein
MYEYLCKSYPTYLAKNKLINDVFQKICGTKDLLTRKFMILVFIGSEPDIANHICNIAERDLDSKITSNYFPETHTLNFGKIKNIVLNRTNRLILLLPKMVRSLAKSSITQYNAVKTAAVFVMKCINLYESGVEPNDI